MTVDISLILPQKPPMVFVSGLQLSDKKSATCWFDLTAETPFVREGRLYEVALIEVGAQTAAVHFHTEMGGAATEEGYLIDIKDFFFFAASVSVGVRIVTQATVVKTLPPFALYRVELHTADGYPLAHGSMKFFAKAV